MTNEDMLRHMRRMVDFQSCGDCELEHVCEQGEGCVFQTVREAVEKVPEWISPADRLPPAGVRVIIARVYEPGKPLRVEQAVYTAQQDWWKVFGANVKTKGVVGWMHMPEPPEVEA